MRFTSVDIVMMVLFASTINGRCMYTPFSYTVFLCRFQGWEDLLEYVTREWSNDIMGRQLPLILKGVGPTHYITQFSEWGLRLCEDYFLLPPSSFPHLHLLPFSSSFSLPYPPLSFASPLPLSSWCCGSSEAPLQPVPGGWSDHVGAAARSQLLLNFHRGGCGGTHQPDTGDTAGIYIHSDILQGTAYNIV